MHEMKSAFITLVVASFHGTSLPNSKFMCHINKAMLVSLASVTGAKFSSSVT